MSEPAVETPPDAPATRVQRRWIVMPFAIFGLLIVAYLAVWFKARDEALQKFAGWVSAEKVRGADVTYDKARVIGLPFRFALEIENLQRTESSGKYWKAAGLRINALPYNLKHVIVEALGVQTFRFADGRVWTLTAESAAMSVHWNKQGLMRLSAIAKNAQWKSDDGEAGSLKDYALQVTPTDKSATALRFQTEGLDGTLPPLKSNLSAFGPYFKSISAKGTISQAAIFKTGFNASNIDLWSAQRGSVKIDDVKVLLGDATLSGSGALNLDRMRRPAGKITLGTGDAKALAERFRQKGWPDQGGASKAVSGAAEIPLVIEDGEVRFWDVPVHEIKPLYAPDVPDASGAPVGAG